MLLAMVIIGTLSLAVKVASAKEHQDGKGGDGTGGKHGNTKLFDFLVKF